MNEIRVPEYFEERLKFESENFSKIKLTEYLDNDRKCMDLTLLRQLYTVDRNFFFDIRDELLLRGFAIDNESPLFRYDKNIIPSHYIYISQDISAFKNINYKLIGLSNLISRFNIQSDFFFNYIPLENFLILNKDINLRLLKEEFLINYFKIISRDELKKKMSNELQIMDPNIAEGSDMYSHNNILITDFFVENQFNKFITFCQDENLIYIKDIDEVVLQKFAKVPFIGIKKVDDVRQRLLLVTDTQFYTKQDIQSEVQSRQGSKINIDEGLRGILKIENSINNPFLLDFCNKNSIKYVEELTIEKFNEFKKTKGVGKKKIELIETELAKLSNRIQESTVFQYDENIYELGTYSCNELLEFIAEDYRLESDLSISNILNKNIGTLQIEKKDKIVLLKLSKILKSLVDPNEIIENAMESLSDRGKKIFILKFKNKQTLQQISDVFGLTRERVRQLLLKATQKFNDSLKEQNFKHNLIFKLTTFFADNIELISGSEFEQIIDSDKLYITQNINDSGASYYYESSYDIYAINQNVLVRFLKDIEDVIDNLPDMFALENFSDKRILTILNNDKVAREDILRVAGYTKTGKIYHKGKPTIAQIVFAIFENHFSKGDTINESSYAEISKIANEVYGYHFNSPFRSAANALNSSELFIMIDSSVFVPFNKDEYNINLLEDCFNYCELELKQKPVISIQEVYDHFFEKLKVEDINNKLYLYTLLKYFYGDYLEFGKGNTLTIRNKGAEKISEIDLLQSLLDKNNSIITKQKALTLLNWSEDKLNLKIYNSTTIVNWSRKRIKKLPIIEASREIDLVKGILEKRFEQFGYITEGQLFQEATFDPELYSFIQHENVETSLDFRKLFRTAIPILKGVEYFISPKSSKYIDIESYLLNKFTEGAYRKDIVNHLRTELLYSEVTARLFLDNMVNKEHFVDIELNYLYPSDKLTEVLKFSEEILEYINTFEKNGYIILKEIEGYSSILPSIHFSWTPYLIKYVLKKNGYRHLQIPNDDYRRDQLVMVTPGSDIETFDKLIYRVLKNLYQGNMHEQFVTEYLKTNGLISTKRDTLPRGIYEKSHYLSVNSIGLVQLGGKS